MPATTIAQTKFDLPLLQPPYFDHHTATLTTILRPSYHCSDNRITTPTTVPQFQSCSKIPSQLRTLQEAKKCDHQGEHAEQPVGVVKKSATNALRCVEKWMAPQKGKVTQAIGSIIHGKALSNHGQLKAPLPSKIDLSNLRLGAHECTNTER
ncbi:hypothetical protein FXO38_19024 [Capsicum annuum]|nr:hypothetical protein FXO38_19024 [Capsicum annuum]